MNSVKHATAWLFAGMLIGSLGWNVAAYAHEDDEPPPQIIVVAPRVETRLGDQELVLTYIGGRIVGFLQRYVDGVPTPGAKIELTLDFMPTDLTEIAPGVYSSDPTPLSGGSNDIDVSLALGDQTQTAKVTLVVTTNAKTAATMAPPIAIGAVPGFVLVIGAVVVFLGVNGLLLRRARPA
jgi:hypothetical protein